MMRIRTVFIAGLCTLSLTVGVGATDFGSMVTKALSEQYSYTALTGDYKLSTSFGEIPYTAGQLLVRDRKENTFLSGYVLQGQFPQVSYDTMEPYFRLHLRKEEWEGLIQANRDLYEGHSCLQEGLERGVQEWANGLYEGVPFTVHMERIEPYRRLLAKKAYVYTAGGQVVLRSGGVEQRYYSRAYFFRQGAGMGVVVLLMADEVRLPLVYDVQDVVRLMADEEAQLGGPEEDRLEVILGHYEIEKRKQDGAMGPVAASSEEVGSVFRVSRT